MQVQNLTTKSFELSGGHRLSSLATITIPDQEFYDNVSLQTQITTMVQDGKATVPTIPAGWAVSDGKFTPSGEGAQGASTSSNTVSVVNTVSMRDAKLVPVGTPEYGVSIATAENLNPPADARYALIQVEGDDARWRDDGNTPTTGVGGGHRLYDGREFLYPGDLDVIQLIGVTGGVTMNVTYYK